MQYVSAMECMLVHAIAHKRVHVVDVCAGVPSFGSGVCMLVCACMSMPCIHLIGTMGMQACDCMHARVQLSACV